MPIIKWRACARAGRMHRSAHRQTREIALLTAWLTALFWAGIAAASDAGSAAPDRAEDGAVPQAVGDPNYALQFDGADDFLRVLDIGNFDFATSLTVELWVKPITVAPSALFRGLVTGRSSDAPNSGGGWAMSQNKDDPSRWGMSICTPGCESAQTPADSLVFDDWNHLAATYDGAEIRVYHNAELVGSTPHSGDVSNVTHLFAGAWTGTFLGTLDEIRIWNVARTQQQILATAFAPLQGNEPGLVAYWPLNEGSGQFTADLTANGQQARLGSTDAADANDPLWVESDSPIIEPTFQLIPLFAGLGTDIGVTSVFGGFFNCGWVPGETVAIWWDKPEAELASFTVDASGCFEGLVRLDDGERIPGSEPGTHQVEARGSLTGTLSSPFEQMVPQLHLSPAQGPSEYTVNVSGCGWDGEPSISIVLQRTGAILARPAVDPATGCISDTLTIPRSKNGFVELDAFSNGGLLSAAAYWVVSPTIFLTPNEGPPGARVPLAGCNWFPEELIDFAFSDDLQVFDTWGTSIGGCITTGGPTEPTLAIPDDAAEGQRTILAAGRDSGALVSVPFNVIERSLLFDPDTGLPGQSIAVSGCSWVGNDSVTIEWGYPDTNGLPIRWQASVDGASGCFGQAGDFLIDVPDNTLTGPVTVTATGNLSGTTVAVFNVAHPGYIEIPNPDGYADGPMTVNIYDAVIGETITFRWDAGHAFDGVGAAVSDFSYDITLPKYASVGQHTVTADGTKGFDAQALVNILDNSEIEVLAADPIYPGSEIRVAGRNWSAGELVRFKLESGANRWPIAGSVTVAADSTEFSELISLPANVPAGAYTLLAEGNKGRAADTGLTLVAPPAPAFSFEAAYADSAPRLDGVLATGEWDYAKQVPLANGFLTARSDETRLYLLLDMLGDSGNDAPGTDNFRLTFDVWKNRQIDAGFDLNFRLDGNGDMILEEYTGPDSFAPRNSVYLRSAYAAGYDCNLQDGSLGFTLIDFIPKITCNGHRIWEIAIDLESVGAQPGGSVAIGVGVQSASPLIDEETPPSFSSDFTHLGKISLADSKLDPDPPAGAVTGIGSGGFDLEVTQAIQEVGNSLPLVADKDTVVRVYPQVQAEALIKVYLYGQRSGVDLPGSPMVALATVPDAIDRGALSHTANFLLPDSWVTAGVTSFIALAENLDGSNTVVQTESVSFYERDIPEIWVYPFNEGTEEAPILPSSAHMLEQEQVLQRLLPTPDVKIVRRSWREVNQVGDADAVPCDDADPDKKCDCETVGDNQDCLSFPAMKRELKRVYRAQAAAKASSGDLSSLPDMLFGFKTGRDPKAVGTSDPIYSGGGSIVVVGQADGSDFNSTTMIHEVNHNLDRSSTGTWGRHVANPENVDSKRWGCGADGPDSAWPYDGTDNVQEVGFDTTTPWTDADGLHKTVVPDTRDDFMSYCWKKGTPIQWISPYRWEAMFNRFPRTSFAAAATTDAAEELAVESVFYVSGELNLDGTGTLDPVQIMPGVPSTDVAPGEYTIEVLDGSEQVLSTLPFIASFTDVEGVDLDTVYFSFEILYQPGAAAIVLMHNGQELDRIVRSPNPPTAEVLSPKDGDNWADEATILWTADDADGDALVFALFYSPNDGTDWYPLASELTDPEYIVPVEILPGGNGGRIMLVVSDGFNTVSVYSSGSFTVPHPAPTVIIDSPVDGQAFAPGSLIDLSGSASDPSGAPSESFTYVWSIDGEVAEIGPEATIALEEGAHTIVLDAYDDLGNHGAASVAVNSTPNQPPHLPGDPTPADAATEVAPSTALSWTGGDPDGDPVTYDVYLEAGTDTPQVLICTGIESTGCAPPSTLLPDSVYYWQVVATDDSNAVRSGAVWMFQTGPAVAEEVIFQDGFE